MNVNMQAPDSPENQDLTDTHNRRINYFRISVTDKCNLKCSYCVSHTPSPKLLHSDILRYEEIIRIVRTGIEHGITKVRITGGEPLVRKGLCDFIQQLTRLEGLTDVSLTTNGILLNDHLATLKRAGIKRLNISLDTLNRDKFKTITGTDGFDSVWEALLTAHHMGFSPIKINTVAIKGLNDDELMDFADLTLLYPFHFRFIEYMPIGEPELKVQESLLIPEIKSILSSKNTLIPVNSSVNDGPADRYRFENSMGELGFISPVSNHFCGSCNRLRLTASGKLRACLLSDVSVDVAGPLRSGCSDDTLFALMNQAVSQKHRRHHLGDKKKDGISIRTQMSSIGG